MGTKKKLVGVYLPLKLIQKLKLHMAQSGMTQSAIVEKALDEYFKKPLMGFLCEIFGTKGVIRSMKVKETLLG